MIKETILAVDDEPANLRMLERLFRKDYNVLTATSGEEALKILSQERVALIITDQRMPGMTGTDLLRKSMHTHPDVAKIILTGHSDMEALIEAINTARVYRYVSKPWDPLDLKSIVGRALTEYHKHVEEKELINGLTSLVQSRIDFFVSQRSQQAEAASNEPLSKEQEELLGEIIKLVQSHPGLFILKDAQNISSAEEPITESSVE